MAARIVIIDYGMGNLRSVQKAFSMVGHEATVTREPRAVADATHVVLPGVGAFADCMRNLDRYDLLGAIRQGITAGKPFLGICLGLQVLFTESEEFGVHKGLDLISGRVRRFVFDGAARDKSETGTFKVPHMGWNTLLIEREAPPLKGVTPGTHVYFVHSYYVDPSDRAVVATRTDYGFTFVSSIWRDNVFACQFHPEKSQTAGLQIIKNFAEWR
ncbi:imidazole glycerol phosphate synthase subunit HisH [Candidatus Nitrospira bockiana]